MTIFPLPTAAGRAHCVFCRTLTRGRENSASPLISFPEFLFAAVAKMLSNASEFDLRPAPPRGIGPWGPGRYAVCKTRGKGKP